VNTAERAARSHARPKREDLLQSNRIEFPGDRRIGREDRFDLAGEVHPSAVLADVERPHAKRIAGEHQRLALTVPQRDRPLTIEPAECTRAPLFVRVDDDFRVTARPEPMAATLQLLAQFEIVEDLAIETDPQRIGFVGQRLLTGEQIDDRQPRMPKASTCIAVDAELVRAAVTQRADHLTKVIDVGRHQPVAQVDDSRDTAHQALTSDTGCTSKGLLCR
jgi:hypothetical protein